MNKNYKKLIFIVLILCLITLPLLASARLVPCGNNTSGVPECKLCHFLILIKNIVDFMLDIIFPLGIFAVLAGGIMILLSRGTQMSIQGKKIITSAIVGIIIALVAWTIVNTIIIVLVGGQNFPGFSWDWFHLDWDMSCPIVTIGLYEPNWRSTYTIRDDTSIPINYSQKNSFIDQIIKLFTKTSSAQITPGVSPGDTLRYTGIYTDISSVDLSNLVIVVDYDQAKISSIAEISPGGVDDGDKITWNIGPLDTQQSATIYFDFVLLDDVNMLLQSSQKENKKSFTNILKSLFNPITKKASGQTSPITIIHYTNIVHVSSNEAETESLNDPLEIRIPAGLFAERQYYLITDINNNGQSGSGDEIRYNIKYYNPTPFAFTNTIIISDYDQSLITITEIDGGGTDDGDRIVWNLGSLPEGEPLINNPGCIGYKFIINQSSSGVISNNFHVISDGGILETHNDQLNTN